MDSLLANYASSDEEEQQNNQKPLQSLSRGSGSLFSRLPPPKSTFNLPPPKIKSNKRIVEFRPPLKATAAEEEDEEEEKEKEPPPKKRFGESSGGGLTSLLPPPKNTQTLGGGGGGGGSRRTILEPTAATAVTPAATPATESVEPQSEASCNVQATQGFVGQYDYNAYYHSETTQQFVGQDDHNGYYYSAPEQVSIETVPPQVQLPVESSSRKRGRKAIEIGCDVIEIKQDELMGNKPRQDQVNLTGIAFGPAYKPASAAKDKPSKLHKRKHQIGSLYYDLKQKEIELAERRSRGHLTKAETQAKYGW